MRHKFAVVFGLGLASLTGSCWPALNSAAQAPDQQAAQPASGPQGQGGLQSPGGQAGPSGQGFDRSQFAGMQRVGGEVTAVSGASVTVKTEDGATYQIVTTDNTRLMKGRGVSLKLADLKVGDGVMAAGNLDAPAKTLHAAVLFATDGAQLREQRANLGKTFIMGKVTAIDLDNARMTVERSDSVSQIIGFDESSSFRRGAGRGRRGAGADPGSATAATAGSSAGAASGPDAAAAAAPAESITLADIKVGDRVRGTGSLKNGVFVPSQLIVIPPGAGRPANGGAGPRGAGQPGLEAGPHGASQDDPTAATPNLP